MKSTKVLIQPASMRLHATYMNSEAKISELVIEILPHLLMVDFSSTYTIVSASNNHSHKKKTTWFEQLAMPLVI